MEDFFTPEFVSQYRALGAFLLIVFTTIVIGFIFRRLYFRFVRNSTVIIRNDPTNYTFLGHALTALIYVLGFSWAIYTLPDLRSVATSLLAGAGILAVAVGFAAQHALSNVISGFFIVIFRPFRVNDRLKIRDTLHGIVEDITLRHTVIRAFENRRIIIPNSVISDDVIVNADMEDEKVCQWIEIGVGYGTRIEHLRRIMKEEIMKHPLHIDPRTAEEKREGRELAIVRVLQWQDSGVLVRGYAWAANAADAFQMKCDLLETFLKRLPEEGIEIPFPHRKIVWEGVAKKSSPTEDATE